MKFLDHIGWPYTYGLSNQFIRIMRLTIIIITIALMQVSAAGLAQKLSLNFKNVPLEQVLIAVKQQTAYNFVYTEDVIAKARVVNIHVENAGLKEVLELCFKNQPLQYNIEQKTIVIREAETSLLDKAKSVLDHVILSLSKDVKGKVVDQDGKPLPNASIRVKGKNTVTNTNAEGEFELKGVDEDAVLQVSYVGFKSLEIPLKGAVMPLEIKLNVVTGELEEVKVIYNTGYQNIDKTRATGSFAHIDNKIFNQQTGTNILDRLKGVASGVLFDDAKDRGTNKLNFNVRGLSTINGPRDPLIVIDNFIYEGNISNINPNDIEDVTVLKDAAATSIYGARGGNGVIVFTTKKGKFNQATTINFNANVIMTEKPDLFYLPQVTSREYVEMEQFLFNKGYYTSTLNNTTPLAPVITPAVDIFNQLKKGLIPKADSARLINDLASIDSKEQYNKYFYRTGLTQTYALNLRGGNDKLAWNISGAADKNIDNLDVTNNKFNLRFDNVYRPVKNLQISVGGYYTNDKSNTGKGRFQSELFGVKRVPYLKFADENENPLPIARFYRESYTDNAGGGKLLSWDYYPLEDYKHYYTTANRNELLANFGINYSILEGLNFDLKYQHQLQKTEQIGTRDKESFYTRDLVNKFSQIDPVNGSVKYIVPFGDIATFTNSSVLSQAFRGQVNYDKNWSEHTVSAMLGTEIREIINEGNTYTVYGYNKDPLSQATIDYLNLYPRIIGGTEAIPGAPVLAPTLNSRFLSFYGNAAYTYKKKYTISGSARRDGANVLGAKTNDKFKPLWSAGLSWLLSDEDFFRLKTMSYLKLRSTYGYSGNVDLRRTALPIAQFFTNVTTNLPAGYIGQLNNPELRWEQVSSLNFGLDFSLKNSSITGSFDYYIKRGSDLYGETPYDYTTFGRSQFITKNVANMKSTGFELALNSQNIHSKNLNWNTSLLLNHNVAKTTKYYTDAKIADLLGTGTGITPIAGKPLYAIAAYKWAGLDAKGNPQSYVNGIKSIDYAAIADEGRNKGLEGNIIYAGNASPTYYGILNNSLRWKNIEGSFSLLYKLGYYFVKPTINYTNLAGSGIGNAEYSDRWQRPGDELTTNVPSFLYPIDSGRDGIYANSEINVLKGDHIRLQYINLAYYFDKPFGKNLGVKSLRLYMNASNLGILWRTNKYHLDPDYPATFRPSRTITFGINTNF